VSIGAPKVYFSEYKDWPPHEKEAIKYAKGRVLDIGCGAGRHALYLQKKGFDVLGIDNSPLAIKVCKLRGLRKVKVVPITQVNFGPGSFDTVLMLGGNFGLFGSFENARQLLKKFYRITSYDARIIAESNDPYKTDNPVHLEYQKFNRRRGRMSGQLRIRVRFEKYVGDWFDYSLVSKEEMKKIIEGTGWKVKRVVDSMKGRYAAIIEKAK
jgi:SAM-dependent methyltransferase